MTWCRLETRLEPGQQTGALRTEADTGSYYIMIARDGRELKLPPFLDYDKAFHAWMKDIPLRKEGRT